PKLREGATQVNGRLPPEVIQRIVRQNFGRFRLCYENGMRANPNLQGRVSVKFVIDRSGAVSMTADGGSDLPDQGVVQCVVRGFGNLSFPQPEGGMVTVVYPIIFNPGDLAGTAHRSKGAAGSPRALDCASFEGSRWLPSSSPCGNVLLTRLGGLSRPACGRLADAVGWSFSRFNAFARWLVALETGPVRLAR